MLREQTIGLLKRYGLEVEAALDEQQLIDPEVINDLIAASEITPQDTVLEIGPGAGNITVEIAKRARKTYAVEKNPKFIPLLNERLVGFNVEIIIGDALALYLPRFDVLVSNLPYAMAEATIGRLKRIHFKTASLLVPLGFANILTAKPEETRYSRLTLEANLFYNISLIRVVKPSVFTPEPKTETSIIKLKPKKATDKKEAVIWHLLQQGDKKVANALRESFISIEGYPSTKREARDLIAKLRLEQLLEKRVAALSLDEIELIRSCLDSLKELPN